MNSRVEEVVQISRARASERASERFFLFRFLIPLSLFEIFYFPDLKKKKDLVLGFSVFLSLFLSSFWGVRRWDTNGGGGGGER